MMKTGDIYLVGVTGEVLAEDTMELLASSAAIVVSARMMPLLDTVLPDYPRSQIFPVSPLKEAIAAIGSALGSGDVAVLASGDPLFFGIGDLLGRRFGRTRLVILPAVSSMQIAFARLGLPWHDARFISLHGRPSGHFAARILPYAKVCILTDKINTPAAIASELLRNVSAERSADFSLFVGEELGCAREKVTIGSLHDIAGQIFSDPNIVIILQKPRADGEMPVFGLGEQDIRHSRGLITKNEVRAAVIHALRLPRQGVFWDIGAGSGSVSVEAARLSDDLQVFAIEKNAEQLDHIRWNRETFCSANIEVIAGEAPEVLAQLPDPDRVFVGGSGGNLARILAVAAGRLKAGGSIVVNAVLAKTGQEAPSLLCSQGLAVEISRITVERQRYPAPEISRFNPISLIVGRKTHGIEEVAENDYK
jgi:precorrin-6B C5,15-methyltransferase / cobalt-precorrin-6B C5,C15-methyltransferase